MEFPVSDLTTNFAGPPAFPGLSDFASRLAAWFVPMSTAALPVIHVAGPCAAVETVHGNADVWSPPA
jgi:hypothetical protein